MISGQELQINFLKMEQNAASIIAQCNNYEGLNTWAHVRFSMCAVRNILHMGLIFPSNIKNISHPKFECSEICHKYLMHMPKKCFLVFANKTYYVEKNKGKLYDPYLDPVMLEALKHNIPTVKFLFNAQIDGETFIPLVPLVVEVVEQKVYDYKSNNFKVLFPWYNSYEKMCVEYNVPQIESAITMQVYLNINAYAKIYEKIFAICQPSMVALSCYECEMKMGMALACSRLNIPCIEMQHGLQSSPHLAYNFSNIPKHGYSVIPQYFFHWGEKASKNMRQQFENQDFHQSFVVGKPTYIASVHGDYVEDEVLLKEFLQKINGYIPICIALPLADKLWKRLEEIIRKSPKEWIWLLRQHPFYSNDQSEKIKILKDIFGDRVEVKCATALSLYAVLQHSKHLLTDVSSCVNEAVSLYHMLATVMGDDALDYFNMAIQDGYVDYCTTVDDVLASIQKGISQYPSTIDTQEVTHDTSLMGKTLKHIYDMHR